jgi:hypothetical protein
MSKRDHKRRWWQFSLRSVLFLTLIVALWLGYEVRQARHTEQTIAALRALGGDAECEPTGWSLLGLCRVPGYGQRIVRVAIPGAAAEETAELLCDLRSLREVEVTYDGTFDPAPSWRRLNETLRPAKVIALTAEPKPGEWLEDESKWKTSPWARRLARVQSKVALAFKGSDLPSTVAARFDHPFDAPTYQVFLLSDGTLAEVVVSSEEIRGIPPTQQCFAILLVDDRCVSVKGFVTSTRQAEQRALLEDIDGDGIAELGFACFRGWRGIVNDKRTRRLPGNSQNWLGVYKIERDGFKSLLPEDCSEFP